MELWLACALLTVVLYGLGEGLSKEPTVRLGPGRMLALYSLYSVPIYAGWFLLGGGSGSLTETGVAFGVASALCGTVGNMLWFMAMESGEASVVSGFTAAYPVVTVIAAVVGLGATLLPLQILSIALLVGATFLLGWADGAPPGPPEPLGPPGPGRGPGRGAAGPRCDGGGLGRADGASENDTGTGGGVVTPGTGSRAAACSPASGTETAGDGGGAATPAAAAAGACGAGPGTGALRLPFRPSAVATAATAASAGGRTWGLRA